jgi:pimeloyl-ACP methyl ester carboxylesterase
MLRENSGKLPKDLDHQFYYENNVLDLVSLIDKLGIPHVFIAGHSYGGGIAYKTALELARAKKVKVESLTMMAPYVQRIDGYHQKNFISGGMAMELTLDVWKNWMLLMGLSRQDTQKIVGNYRALAFQHQASVRSFYDGFDRTILSRKDDATDIPFDGLMREAYSEYIANQLGKKSGTLTPAEREDVANRTATAIALTKGIRDLDLLDYSRAMDIPYDVPIRVLYGTNDILVPSTQVLEFVERLRQNGHSNVEAVPIQNGTHGFVYTNGARVFDLIRGRKK